MIRLSAKEASALGYSSKEKYSRKKAVVDGHKFDSKKEAGYYCQLLILLKAGQIKSIELQPEFLLQPKFKVNGKCQRAIKYIADFKIIWADGRVEVVDVKGMKTQIYRLKKKLLLYKYPQINFKEV